MRTVDIIQNKRDGKELSTEEIHFLIEGYTAGSIPDYQLSAWAMAVNFQGMTAGQAQHRRGWRYNNVNLSTSRCSSRRTGC